MNGPLRHALRTAAPPARRYDVLIVGAGPAGMAAARAAADCGCTVALIDDNPAPGGQIWRDGPGLSPPPAARRLRQAIATRPRIALFTQARVIAAPAPHTLLVENDETALHLHFRSLILCTGARELLLPFPGWTLPGATGAGGLQALVKAGTPVDGERLVIAGSGPLLLAVAATARRHGARIACIAEQASLLSLMRFAGALWRWPAKAAQAATLLDSHYRARSHVVEALGDDRLRAVRIRQGGSTVELPCDRLACGFGLVPNTGLAALLGCRLDAASDAVAVDALQRTSLRHVHAAGECTGIGGSELALLEGEIAGYAAAGADDRAGALLARRARWRSFAGLVRATFALDPALKALARPDTLVCRCEDVPLSAIRAHPDAWQAKMQSRCGMGACQGRICATASRVLFGWPLPTPRPPLSPARIGTLMQQDSAGPS
ncbi:FAD/NAD(P)-binding oxidoreductase [Cupriavidus basilensis]|uniref:FAD/NAD(P)-binding oxidoreductase n=1 Tax=Cupriavidus basilensis TaxID=68895 RepID=A0ABT6B1A3_9BURK|nr:FAD/NAD(P)-binding oxidoreductase [Cupriavidus basilensis]MDF3838272.1 FAD/NAD(P)-binding oxidoreductase [Cupriavidus basilensis]